MNQGTIIQKQIMKQNENKMKLQLKNIQKNIKNILQENKIIFCQKMSMYKKERIILQYLLVHFSAMDIESDSSDMEDLFIRCGDKNVSIYDITTEDEENMETDEYIVSYSYLFIFFKEIERLNIDFRNITK